MANTPSTRWNVQEVLSACRELSASTDLQRVLQEQGKYFYKLALSEIVTLLNSSADPAYYDSTTLTVGADMEMLKDSANSSGTITSITAGTNTIVRSAGTFGLNDIIHVTIISSAAAITAQFIARITTGGASAVYTVLDGSDATLGGTDRCSVIVIKTYSTTSADISGVNVDRVLAIVDSTYGLCPEVSTKEFFSLSRTGFANSSYKSDIVWTQIGNTIYFLTGESCTSPGTKTMYFQRQPDYPTAFDTSEYPDLADKFMPLLIKRIFTLMVLQVENDIPKNLAQEMQMDYAQISSSLDAEIKNRFKMSTNTKEDRRGR